jgi:L-ascorbate metabolism protein UlaG (beta-lactamase superfamily)
MSTQIRFLGVAGYEITWADKRLLIDPFLSESPAAPIQPDELETPDLILVSHAACDHLGDTEIFGDMRLIAELYRPSDCWGALNRSSFSRKCLVPAHF